MPVSFLNPALLFGLLGASAPLLVHLLGRRKGKERRFAAIDFLLGSEKRLAARRRVRHLLLLVVRMALVALIALALARPLQRAAASAIASEPVSVAVVLDRTASMGAVIEGRTAFSRAQERLADLLGGLEAGSEAMVVTLERRPRRLTADWVSPAEAARVVRRTNLGATHATLAPALESALAVFAGAHRPRHLVVIATDLQKSTVEDASLKPRPAGAPRVVWIDAGEKGIAGNIALDDAVVAADGGRALSASAQSHGGGSPMPDTLVRLLVEGEVKNRAFVRWDPEGRGSARLSLPEALPPGADLSLDLAPGGALASDDHLSLYLDRPRRVRVLLADGAPRPDLVNDEVFYLERAIESDPDHLSRQVVDASGGQLGPLDGFDVVVLANPGRLDPASAAALGPFVNGGGGLLVTAGDGLIGTQGDQPPDPTLLAFLPAVPRSVFASREGAPPLALEAPAPPLHPLWRPFDTALAVASLTSARFARVLAVADPAPETRVLLRFGNGLPALLEGRRGRGRTALFTATVDRDWTDFPVKPSFAPVLNRLLLYLGGQLERPERHTYLPGDRVVRVIDPPPAAGERLAFEAPAGGEVEVLDSGRGRFETETVEQTGRYRARVGERREPALDFVVNPDPAESDLGRADESVLRAWVEPEPEAGSGAPLAAGTAREATPVLLVLAAFCFALESWLGKPAASGPGGAG